MRNGPYRWKASAIRRVVVGHKAAVNLILAPLTREDPREGVSNGPPRTGVRGATRTSEVGRIDRSRDKHPCGGCKSPIGMNAARRSGDQGAVNAPSPGHVVGPKARRSARRASDVDAPGTDEYGCS